MPEVNCRPLLVVDRAGPAAHPGLFARHYERAFYDGVQKLANGKTEEALAAFRDADLSDDKHRAISPALLVGILTFELGDPAAATPHLERVTASAQALPDELMSKYASGLLINVAIGHHIEMPIEIGSVAASLVLAECYRDAGRVHEGIGLMQQLYDQVETPSMLLVLCSMYREAEDWDEIVHATAGIKNDDDLTLLLRLLQAEAMERQDLPDAALESYRDALRSTKRDPELLRQARYGRAVLCMRTGKRAMAKRDLGRLYGEDPDYKDVSGLLRELAWEPRVHLNPGSS